MSKPIDVTLVPIEPGSGYVLAVEHDPFDDDAVSAVVDLGPLIAWRFDTYFDGARVITARQPVGIDPEPSGDDWTTEVHTDLDSHRSALAAHEQAAQQHDRHTTTTEENSP
jgi:hypothetical protein